MNWCDHGVHVLNLPLSSTPPALAPLTLTVGLLKAVLASSPDIVHCFKPKAYSGLVAAVLWLLQCLGLWRGVLFVDTDDWEGRGGWNEASAYSWWQRRVFAWQERWGLSHNDGVTCASRWLEARVQTMCKKADDRISYVPNGVCVQDWDSSLSRPSPDQATCADASTLPLPVALLYTRFLEFAIDNLARMWRQVIAAVPGAQLLVVGQGFAGEERELRRLAIEGGWEGSISLAGWVELDSLPRFLSLADLVLMPVEDTIINQAKSPARLLDVMAVGLPVVTHAVGEYADMVQDGVSGVVVETSSWSAFAAATVALLTDRALCRKMGHEAWRRARDVYSWDGIAAIVEQAYLRSTGPAKVG